MRAQSCKMVRTFPFKTDQAAKIASNLNKMDTLSITQGLFKRTIHPQQSFIILYMELGQFHTWSNLKSVIFNKPEFLKVTAGVLRVPVETTNMGASL